MGILEKISEIEREIARTQKNKGNLVILHERYLVLIHSNGISPWSLKSTAKKSYGLMKGKIGKKGEGFDVVKSGDARVVMIGLPSAGKSTLLSKLTATHSEVAAYEFTTLTCIPGKIEHNGASIQLLDLPGIIEGAAEGKGRGRQVVAVAKTADLVLMMLDATRGPQQLAVLERELEAVGIRLNKSKPNIYFKPKAGGGLTFNATVPLTHLNEKLVQMILHDYKIFNAEVLIREDCTVDEFIDVLLGNRKYVPCLYCYNKIDSVTMEEIEVLAHKPNSVVISCRMDMNLDYLVKVMWKMLSLTRIYTKKRGEFPDFNDCLIMRGGCSIEHVCKSIHRSLLDEFKLALVWGTSAKHQPQKVGLAHTVEDEDVVQIIKKR